MNLNELLKNLRKGANSLAIQNANSKNTALEAVATALNNNRNKIIEANQADIENGRKTGMSESLIDRLMLDNNRIDGIIQSVRNIINQTDPIGEEVSGWKTPNGLNIRQIRVPLGVVAIIYESRPNVTVDAFSLAYKSGNAILLRGSSSAFNSNKAIVQIIKDSLKDCADGVPDAIELVEVREHDHSDVDEILNAVGKIDVVLPRGGKKLIQSVVSNARIPVIETGSGVCHLYIDETADIEKAVKIAENAKIQRPSVCNAVECIVVHKNIACSVLPLIANQFNGRVCFHADEESYNILKNCDSINSQTCNQTLEQTCTKNSEQASESKKILFKATNEDFGHEYLDYECCIKIVDSIQDAISYINSHNTKHSESIITESRANARIFQSMIDASCVYVNASTRFTDGGEFGFGAELGISTQKLHARGPMGIKALTTTKYLIDGDGQIR